MQGEVSSIDRYLSAAFNRWRTSSGNRVFDYVARHRCCHLKWKSAVDISSGKTRKVLGNRFCTHLGTCRWEREKEGARKYQTFCKRTFFATSELKSYHKHESRGIDELIRHKDIMFHGFYACLSFQLCTSWTH